jgi:class 3 adenylate cyclase
MKAPSSAGAWIFPDCQQFITHLFLSQHVDEPLTLLQRKVFTEVCGKLLRYSICTHALHVFCNAFDASDHDCPRLEFDVLHVGPAHEAYVKRALIARHLGKDDASLDDLPEYVEIPQGEHAAASGLFLNLMSLMKPHYPCRPLEASSDSWKMILNHIKTKILTLDCRAQTLLVVPLSEMLKKYPCGNLGAVLLWSNDPQPPRAEIVVREERLRPAAKLISASLKRFLTIHYQMSEQTYLPKFKLKGKRQIAIMFADIRNFTPTTEIFRNFDLVDDWLEFMHSFCRDMGAIIASHGGRVQSFSGDGIMALFGEYVVTEAVAASSAVKAAREMYVRFRELKHGFLAKPAIQHFLHRECDPIEFDLGVGLNYGPVIFDYFGPRNRRVFAPLGDHVNFAQRLESNACRFDPQLGRRRAPVLLSRPLWSVLGKPAEHNSVWLDLKGKSNHYEAFECWPSGCSTEVQKKAP